MTRISYRTESEPWQTVSFHTARLFMVLCVGGFWIADALLDNNQPPWVAFALIVVAITDAFAVQELQNRTRRRQNILTDGSPAAHRQQKQMTKAVAGMIAAATVATFWLYPVVATQTASWILWTILAVGANASGWFLLGWLREIGTLRAQARARGGSRIN